jgi:hypothetical protein
MKDERILNTMTVAEALPFISTPALRVSLQHWAETFGVALRDFHAGHFVTYRQERSQTTYPGQVFAEMRALAELLDQQDIKIDLSSVPLKGEDPRPTPDELAALPANIRTYILALEREVGSLKSTNHTISDRLRRRNWAR